MLRNTCIRCGLGVALLIVAALLPGCFSGDLRIGDLLLGTPTPRAAVKSQEAPTVTAASPGLKPPGRILFAAVGKIWLWEDGAVRTLTDGQSDLQPAWAPDGKRFTYVARNEMSSDIYTLQMDTGTFEQLTAYRSSRSKVWVFRPSWSPDGNAVSFLCDLNANDLALWSMNLSGGGWRRLAATDWRGGIDSYSWAPSGKQLVIGGFRSEQEQIWLYTLATGQWQQLTNVQDGAYDPQFSPDGTRIAYVAREDGKHNVWTMSADGSNQARLVDDGVSRSPVWSPAGDYIAYLSTRGGVFDVWATRSTPSFDGARGSDAVQLTKNQNVDSRGGLSWSR